MTKKSILRLLQASLMCCLAVLFTACDDIFASEDNPTPAYLSMSDKPVTLKVGDTYRRKAISVTSAVVEYTSSKTDVATVDGEGMVTAIAEGTTTITATATGYSSQNGNKIYQPASVSYVVTVTPAASATITNPPVATPGDIAAGSETALVTAGVADGGTMMYEVTATNTKPTSLDGFSATIPTAAALAMGTYYVWYYAKGDATHSDSEIAAAPVEVTVKPGLVTPLTLEALTAGTIKVSNPQPGMQYTLNGDDKKAVPDGTPIDVAVGDKVSFYGDGTNITAYSDGSTNTNIKGGTAEVKVYGNIMSLVDEDNFATNKTLTADYTFYRLFKNYTTLKDASDLLLPATTLAYACYNGMFRDCTSLTTAPAEIPAMTMASQCCGGMFRDCTSLTTAPKLPATTLGYACYYYMFSGCTSLIAAPELPATDLTGASYCYCSMFQGCTSLTAAPELKATKIADNCYNSMFKGCTSLIAAPELKATMIANDCYNSMFYGCTSLTTAPAELPAMTMASQCYAGMFFNCTSLTTAPKLPATTLVYACYYCMFYGCTSLTTAYVKAAYTTAYGECSSMFSGCQNLNTCTLYTDGNWSSYNDISSWTKVAYPTE